MHPEVRQPYLPPALRLELSSQEELWHLARSPQMAYHLWACLHLHRRCPFSVLMHAIVHQHRHLRAGASPYALVQPKESSSLDHRKRDLTGVNGAQDVS